MAVRMAQEIGLHREAGSLDSDSPQLENHDSKSRAKARSSVVDLETFNKSSRVILFWCLFAHDTSLCNGTGRVPALKEHEINVRFPNDTDLAIIRAGPGGTPAPVKAEVYPSLARMMLDYARSIDFLNTGSSQIRYQSPADNMRRMDRIEEHKQNMIKNYRSIPNEVSFGAIYYQKAVKAGQAGPYLLLHLQYHLQIAFLTQESLAGVPETLTKTAECIDTNAEATQAGPEPDVRKIHQELYRSAIKAITDIVTFAKLIYDRPLLTVVYLNQSFFHAACAYSRDMLQGKENTQVPNEELSPSAFPIPSQT